MTDIWVDQKLSWIENLADQILKEAKELGAMVEGGRDQVEELASAAAGVHFHAEALKGKLQTKPEAVPVAESEAPGEEASKEISQDATQTSIEAVEEVPPPQVSESVPKRTKVSTKKGGKGESKSDTGK